MLHGVTGRERRACSSPCHRGGAVRDGRGRRRACSLTSCARILAFNVDGQRRVFLVAGGPGAARRPRRPGAPGHGAHRHRRGGRGDRPGSGAGERGCNARLLGSATRSCRAWPMTDPLAWLIVLPLAWASLRLPARRGARRAARHRRAVPSSCWLAFEPGAARSPRAGPSASRRRRLGRTARASILPPTDFPRVMLLHDRGGRPARHHLCSRLLRAAAGGVAPAFWPLWPVFCWGGMNALFLAADRVQHLRHAGTGGTGARWAWWRLAGGAAAAGGGAALPVASALLGSLRLPARRGACSTAATARWRSPTLRGRAAARALAAAVALAPDDRPGCCVKAALFPLHVWLPPAHAGAPGAGQRAALGAGGEGLASTCCCGCGSRSSPRAGTPAAARLLGAAGRGARSCGARSARCGQQRLKLLVAYSTVAQLGYLFLLFPLAGAARRRASRPGAARSGRAGATPAPRPPMFLAAGVHPRTPPATTASRTCDGVGAAPAASRCSPSGWPASA
ncbi:MAG: hypothetical protein MZW92_52965 [Comamonadaceae bacterium]|nr:hypothetical protein [Comamonadaceae bacterium]